MRGVVCVGVWWSEDWGWYGKALLGIVATFLMASRVSSVTVRHGTAGIGVLRIASMSCTVFRKSCSVDTCGKGTVVGRYCTVSAILTLFVFGI